MAMPRALVLLFLLFLGTNVNCDYDEIEVVGILKAIESATENLEATGKVMEDLEEYVDLFESGVDMYDALTFFISIAGTSQAPENEFVVALKSAFATVNSRLHELDYGFEDIKRQIDWTTMRVNIMKYEHAIRSLAGQLQLFFDSPAESRETFKDMFLQSYPFVFENAPLKIYLMMRGNGSIFQANIFKIARRFLHNNRRNVSAFMGYLLRLIVMGSQVQCAYLRLSGSEITASQLKEEWKSRFDELRAVMRKVDKDMIDAWVYQYRLDADLMLTRYSQSLSNKDLTYKMYFFLKEKYPWRIWFVLVYDFTDDDKNRYFDNCGQYTSGNVYGKGAVVNSIPSDQGKPRVDIKKFFNMVKDFEGQDFPYGVWAELAKIIFNKEKSTCDSYVFKGVLQAKSNPFFIGIPDFYSFRNIQVLRHFHPYKPYLLFVFA